ncbi:antibiotic biosynthesis monooxygenase family protein [Piscinibacter sakaiensis]|uniref:antibiotic biosynthesis monooxygenase family protein n=1 Tax=Piscinibacter sakaiensis TaxID=1547922 RepID=UPI003AACC268
MILEVADLRIKPGQQAEFETALAKGVGEVISKADGYLSHKVQKCIETPERYLLMIEWQTLEHHTVTFREGPLFPQWRAIVGPFFASAPVVEHFKMI